MPFAGGPGRLDGGIEELFDQAIARYRTVAGQLKAVVALCPSAHQDGSIRVDDTSRAAQVAPTEAKEAAAGLQALAAIVSELASFRA